MQAIINQHKAKIEELESTQETSRQKIIVELIDNLRNSKKSFGALWS